MFVKLYRYHLKSGKEQEYLKIQKQADRIYSSYIDKKTLHLQSSDDRTKWLEVHIYQNEKSYIDTIHLIDEQPEIQELYKRFLELIISMEDISEENYNLIDLRIV